MQIERSAQDAKIRISGVVFDYGKVLCLPQQPSDIEAMARVSGMPVPRFHELYWKSRIDYDRSQLNADSYWGGVAREEGKVFRQEQIEELVALDGNGWSHRNEETLEWVADLCRAGLRLGILSNMPPEIARYLSARCEWLKMFDVITFSCDVGYAKPDPAIYEICRKEMALPAREILFLDDIAANVDGASAAGIHAVIFDTTAQTRARVGERFDLTDPHRTPDLTPDVTPDLTQDGPAARR